MKLDAKFFETVRYCECFDVEHFRTYDTEVLYVWENGSDDFDPVIELTLFDGVVSMTGRYFDVEDYDSFINQVESC